MQHHIPLTDLPIEIIDQTANYLDLSTIQALSCTTSFYHGFFATKLGVLSQIKNAFNFTEAQLILLYPLMNKIEWPKKIQSFASFLKSPHCLTDTARYFLQDIPNRFQLFICSTDYLPLFLQVSNPSDFMLHYELSLHMGCSKIPQHIYHFICEDNKKNLRDYQEHMHHLTARSGRLDMVRFLFATTPPIQCRAQTTLLAAAQSGNMQLMDYYLNTHQLKLGAFENDENNDDEIDVTNPLNHAADKGHFEMVLYLLCQGAQIDDDTLNCAAHAGSLKLVKYFIETNEKIPTQTTFKNAIIAGNKKLINFLATQYFEQLNLMEPLGTYYATSRNHHLQYDYIARIIKEHIFHIKRLAQINYYIAVSGNVNLYELADKENNYFKHQFATLGSLDTAAEHGNLEIVQILLNEQNNVKLLPQMSTLHAAILSQNDALVRFLLEPTRRFYVGARIKIQPEIGAIRNLISAHRLFFKTLQKTATCQDVLLDTSHNITKATRFFALALHKNIEHAAALFREVLLNPGYYRLTPETVRYLRDEFQKQLDRILNTSNEHTSSYVKRIATEQIHWLSTHQEEITSAANTITHQSNTEEERLTSNIARRITQ